MKTLILLFLIFFFPIAAWATEPSFGPNLLVSTGEKVHSAQEAMDLFKKHTKDIQKAKSLPVVRIGLLRTEKEKFSAEAILDQIIILSNYARVELTTQYPFPDTIHSPKGTSLFLVDVPAMLPEGKPMKTEHEIKIWYPKEIWNS